MTTGSRKAGKLTEIAVANYRSLSQSYSRSTAGKI